MTDLPTSSDVVVVGGGVIGMFIAFSLAEAGMKPLLLEARAFGGAVTGAALPPLARICTGERNSTFSPMPEAAGGRFQMPRRIG